MRRNLVRSVRYRPRKRTSKKFSLPILYYTHTDYDEYDDKVQFWLGGDRETPILLKELEWLKFYDDATYEFKIRVIDWYDRDEKGRPKIIKESTGLPFHFSIEYPQFGSAGDAWLRIQLFFETEYGRAVARVKVTATASGSYTYVPPPPPEPYKSYNDYAGSSSWIDLPNDDYRGAAANLSKENQSDRDSWTGIFSTDQVEFQYAFIWALAWSAAEIDGNYAPFHNKLKAGVQFDLVDVDTTYYIILEYRAYISSYKDLTFIAIIYGRPKKPREYYDQNILLDHIVYIECDRHGIVKTQEVTYPDLPVANTNDWQKFKLSYWSNEPKSTDPCIDEFQHYYYYYPNIEHNKVYNIEGRLAKQLEDKSLFGPLGKKGNIAGYSTNFSSDGVSCTTSDRKKVLFETWSIPPFDTTNYGRILGAAPGIS